MSCTTRSALSPLYAERAGSGPDDDALTALARDLASVLRARALRLVTAESCTGGWVAKVCTDLPGSSRWFEHGLVTYSNTAKTALLGVPNATLEAAGAVSGETAQAMARGAQGDVTERVAVAITGVAGPDGGTAAKPVGLVWFAWALPDGRVETQAEQFSGDRAAVRRQSVALALSGLTDRLTSSVRPGQSPPP